MQRVLASLLVAAFLLALVPGEALAISRTTILSSSTTLTDATVNLYCRLKAGKMIYGVSGSGVFLGDKGVILTNAHVAQYFLLAGEEGRVTGWCSVRTGSPAKEMYTAEVLYLSPTWLSENLSLISETRPSGSGEGDFALLYVTGPYKKGKEVPATFPGLPLPALPSITQGAKVTIVGYPIGSLDFSQARNRLTVVNAPSTIDRVQGFAGGTLPDVITLASSTAAAYGVSGGLIADTTKNLIGIVTSKSSSRLRGLSLPYIDRALTLQSGASLSSMLAGDLPSRAAITRLLIPQTTIDALAKGLRSKNR